MIQLPEEIQNIINEMREKESKDDFDQVKSEVLDDIQKNNNSEWDVRIGDHIDYFDINLSYELTGYKPINKTKGLDFDPNWFTEARDTFNRTGHYSSYREGTKLYNDFWTKQYIYCRNGMTVNGYTITGNHYFFLNFYQLPNSETDLAGASRSNIFPKFLVYQYEYFHYFELCRRLRKNSALMKSRGIGFSEVNAAIIANLYNSFAKSNSLVTATTEAYVTQTLQKVWDALSFLNDNTDGGFFKPSQVLNNRFERKASYLKKVNGQEIEDGPRSQIKGLVADRSSKIRGQRVDLILLEESGHNKELQEQIIKGEALCTLGTKKFGIISIGGR